MPFAVVGSREEMVVGGNKVRVRQYPWGTVESELAAFEGGGGGGRMFVITWESHDCHVRIVFCCFVQLKMRLIVTL